MMWGREGWLAKVMSLRRLEGWGPDSGGTEAGLRQLLGLGRHGGRLGARTKSLLTAFIFSMK